MKSTVFVVFALIATTSFASLFAEENKNRFEGMKAI